MKKTILFAVSVMLLIASSFAGNQDTDRQTRDLKGFTKVNFGISGYLYIDFGQEFSVVLEGSQSDLENIETVVTDGRLTFRKDNWRINTREKVTVYITMPSLEGLSVSGSGTAEIRKPVVEADDLSLSVSGSGKLFTSDISTDKLRCAISGSGDIIIRGGGSADEAEIMISGSGNYEGEQFEIDDLDVRVSGSGNCVCRVGERMEASISGSGNVTYMGENPSVDARVSGSGKVRSR